MVRNTRIRRNTLPVLEIIGAILIIIAMIVFITQLSAFSKERRNLPLSMVMGDVPVGGLSRIEAQAYLENVYGNPVTVILGQEELHLLPAQVSFQIDSESMLSQADELRTEGTFWTGFWDYLWNRPEQQYSIPLVADYSTDQLKSWVEDVAQRYNREPSSPQVNVDGTITGDGAEGMKINTEKTLELIDSALMTPVNRVVEIPMESEEALEVEISTLDRMVREYILSSGFQGLVSVYVIDLQTGEEVELAIDMRDLDNPEDVTCDVAFASTSTIKIPIMAEYFRYMDELPLPYELEKIEITMTLSGNWSANSMLLDIGGGDQITGTQIVTGSMQNTLGLTNTFIAAPFDEEVTTFLTTPAFTAARDGSCINTNPDIAMQTTPRDLAVLLEMIYACAETGGGGLVAAYGDQFNQTECQMMLDIMSQNFEGQLIMAGVPEDVVVAHKHGWASDTHSDAGIVFSPGGDYVIAFFLWAEVDWLPAALSFPVMEGLSATVFNYFNPDKVDVPRRGINTDVLEGGE